MTGSVLQGVYLHVRLYNRSDCTQGTVLCTFNLLASLSGTSTALPTIGTPPETFANGVTMTLSGLGTLSIASMREESGIEPSFDLRRLLGA